MRMKPSGSREKVVPNVLDRGTDHFTCTDRGSGVPSDPEPLESMSDETQPMLRFNIVGELGVHNHVEKSKILVGGRCGHGTACGGSGIEPAICGGSVARVFGFHVCGPSVCQSFYWRQRDRHYG